MPVNQRNVTRNQSTADYSFRKMFIFDNRFQSGVYKNGGSSFDLQTGVLVARAAGSAQKATVVFSATPLSAGQTVTLGGLTYTSTGATTREQLANAFANLAVGDTTGPGEALGDYSGTLTGFSTGNVINGTTVVFTSIVTGASTPLAQTGTGAAAAITVVAGVAAVVDGLIPVTANNLADVIGVSAMEYDVVTLDPSETLRISYCTKGTIDSTLLVLPAGVTLNTAVGNKTLGDILEGIGLNLEKTTVDNTKFDN